MKKFSDMGIKPTFKGFIGDKIDIAKLFNREIAVEAFRIEDSKHKKNEKCLYLQISMNGTKHVVFSGSTVLQEMIQRIPEDDFPFTTTIVLDNKRLEFT